MSSPATLASVTTVSHILSVEVSGADLQVPVIFAPGNRNKIPKGSLFACHARDLDFVLWFVVVVKYSRNRL